MKRSIGTGLVIAAFCAGSSFAQTPPAKPAPTPAPASDALPMVPPAKPGVFTAQKKGNGYHLVVVGHKYTTRDDVEKYLAYRAAELTMEQKSNWFTLTETRAKTDTAPVPKRDPAGLRYSFRMEYWRPVWRYKVSGNPAWQSWSPFAGAEFPKLDPKTVTDFEVSADIVLRQGPMDDANPLAFEAGAVSDLLINQVSPPE